MDDFDTNEHENGHDPYRKRRWIMNSLAVLLVLILYVTLTNAHFYAPTPQGKAKLIAHRGVYQMYSPQGLGRDTCTADRIYPPTHQYLENTVSSINRALVDGAYMVEVDVAPTKDGEMVLFHDWAVDCRTNGKGETRDLTLAQLKALDIGYGYTADGGKTYPFRGRTGMMPTVKEGLYASAYNGLFFNFKSKNAGEADLLSAQLKAAGRDPKKSRDAVYGAQGPVDRMRVLHPGIWAWSKEEVKACTTDYLMYGWTGIVPESCRDRTIIVPLNYQWAFWGWPDRMIARMESVNARIILTGPYESGARGPKGLTKPEQIGDVPVTFNGYVWVENIHEIGPALKR
jgi:glycerophosphoryl diester phosphodiesterase